MVTNNYPHTLNIFRYTNMNEQPIQFINRELYSLSNYWCPCDESLEAMIRTTYENYHTSHSSATNENDIVATILADENLIPTTIHFIWLGSPIQEVHEQMIETWRNIHPGYHIVIWDDAAVASFLSTEMNEFFLIASNFGMKSDILRYYILYQLGGVYADVDYECIRSIDDIRKSCAFFAGISNTKAFEVNNGLIG
jgi:mannosyltransferase OCH1-like enzyme